ncbi:hypothetical protein LPJ53_004135 [Coemansia erecta]|uniref:DH domain-containing protein n=1 Tax=Coemansia erecta TaxID=147472 RepID=A0A9W7XUY3_9FUNG|nr:hypothetical protein LPJ53_004135 [Coemansia erecta]
MTGSPPTTPKHQRGAAAFALAATDQAAGTSAGRAHPLFYTPQKQRTKQEHIGSPARRFDRTPTSIQRTRVATIAIDTHIDSTVSAEKGSATANIHRTGSTRDSFAHGSYTVSGSRYYTDRAEPQPPTTPTRPSKRATAGEPASLFSVPKTEFTFRSPPPSSAAASGQIEFPSLFVEQLSPLTLRPLGDTGQQQQQQQPNKQAQVHLEFVGAALLHSLSRRATISEHKYTSLRIGTDSHSAYHQHNASGSNSNSGSSQRKADQGGVAMGMVNDALHSADEVSIEAAQARLTPVSRGSYEIPNDNENDGQYATEFWLNALVPKPHTNFFGYEATIGPICISISTRESHECYKALVRTPFKFGVVYVPIVVINEPIFGTDLDRLSSPTPPKILLYHALRLYFQQADIERRGYLLTALRNRRLAIESAQPAGDTLGSRFTDRPGAAADDGGDCDDCGDTAEHWRKSRRKLQRSGTKRSVELRRAEISEFMDTIFNSGGEGADTSADDPGDEAVLNDEISAFLAAERSQRDLAVATESLTEIRDDHLKPLLRNLEPLLFRRRLRLDFVIVGAGDSRKLADDADAPHRRFLRTLERASLRARGDQGSGAAKLDGGKPDAKVSAKPSATAVARRIKTREELAAKRANIIQELIATERSYVEKLRALIDIYAVPLRSAARSANNTLIPAYDAHVIFGNIERVTEVNERFLGDLEAWAAGEMDPCETIGSLCRDHFVDFHVYKRYINGYQHALAASRELEAKNPLYAAFLQRAREHEECRKLGISDLLIMPVQRIPRYTLLLTDLLKATDADDDDIARITLALARVNEIGQLADNQVAESVAELHRIHTTVEDCPPNLISASREFIGAIDASEIDLVTGAPKRPVSLLVFSDLLMVVERFWPPHDHGGIRITEHSAAKTPASVSAAAAAAVAGAAGPESETGSGDASLGSASFLSTTSDPSRGKRWGRFSGWVDITRVCTLEKSLGTASRAFYIHRLPTGSGTATTSGAAQAQASSQAQGEQRSSASSMVSLDSGTAASPVPTQAPELLHQEFARILYPAETVHESYGEHGYWFPQSLHEFEADHPQTREAFFEFLNTAWERSVARCFESTATTTASSNALSRKDSGSGNVQSSNHRRAKSGIDLLQLHQASSSSGSSLGHPELDRVDVGGQSWSVRIWDAADYARSRASCPAALAADMAVVWDYRQVGSPALPAALPAYCPLQACRIVDFGDDYFHVTSTVLPFDASHATEPDTCAELLEEREIADSWPALCRLVEQAVVMYQYVLLAYPEHRRIQQCYNRSILASLFGQNALGSSSSVKAETAVSAAPRKLFSRARHLFSSSRLRNSVVATPHKGGTGADTGNLFSSAYSNAVAADTVGPSAAAAMAAASSPYSHSTISTPLAVLGRYKLKTKSSTMVSSRRVHTLQHDPQAATPPSKSASAGSTPSRAATSHGSAHFSKPSLNSSATFSAGDASVFSLATTSSSTSTVTSNKANTGGRKIAHTIDDFPSFSSSMLTDDTVDIRTRSHSSWEQRTRASTSIASMTQQQQQQQQQPNQFPSRLFTSKTSKDDALGLLPPSLSGSSPSLVKLGEQAAARVSKLTADNDTDVYTKRRSMSVVSATSVAGGISALEPTTAGRTFAAPSISSGVSAVSTTAPSSSTRGLQGDSGSEFSLSLDILQTQGEKLAIPDDLKLEFDAALSRADGSPPQSTRGLALDIQSSNTPPLYDGTAPKSASERTARAAGPVGLSVLIPSSTDPTSAVSTSWDIVSPDFESPSGQRHKYPMDGTGSADHDLFSASHSALSGTVGSSKSVDRRRGVYGAPPHSATDIPTSPQSAHLIRPQVLFSEADILLDIARELGEDDEPFNNPANINSLYVDDDDVARHMSHMSLGSGNRPQTSAATVSHSALSSPTSPNSGPVSPTISESIRPLPSVPTHSKSLNYGSERYGHHATNSQQLFGTVAPASASPMTGSPSAWSVPANRSRIPHPPLSTYSLHQNQSQQSPLPSPSSASLSAGDYRRLPSLPPRVRSAAASSYLDRTLSPQAGPTSPAGRTQPAFPPI